jgi:hypothetical protein
LTWAVGCLLAAALAQGCGAAAHTDPKSGTPAPLRPPPPVEAAGLSDRAWGSAVSSRYSVVVALPERDSWQIDDTREAWWTARHRASQSELSVRTWRAGRLVTAEDCKKQIRLWRPEGPDPEARPESVIERRVIDAPAGYATELVVGVQRGDQGSELEGFVIAVGHTIGECYAALYSTRAGGKNPESTLGERLALVTEGILPRIAKRGIEDRVR